MSSMNRYAEWINITEIENPLIPSQTFFEMYKLAIVVPKLRNQVSFLKFFTFLGKSVWAWLLLFHVACAVLHSIGPEFKTSRDRFLNSLFVYFEYFIGEFNAKLTTRWTQLTTMAWSVAVSLVVAETLKGIFLTTVAMQRKRWPKTIDELYDYRGEISRHLAIDRQQLRMIGLPDEQHEYRKVPGISRGLS